VTSNDPEVAGTAFGGREDLERIVIVGVDGSAGFGGSGWS